MKKDSYHDSPRPLITEKGMAGVTELNQYPVRSGSGRQQGGDQEGHRGDLPRPRPEGAHHDPLTASPAAISYWKGNTRRMEARHRDARAGRNHRVYLTDTLGEDKE